LNGLTISIYSFLETFSTTELLRYLLSMGPF
jgi:hypothetical protein